MGWALLSLCLSLREVKYQAPSHTVKTLPSSLWPTGWYPAHPCQDRQDHGNLRSHPTQEMKQNDHNRSPTLSIHKGKKMNGGGGGLRKTIALMKTGSSQPLLKPMAVPWLPTCPFAGSMRSPRDPGGSAPCFSGPQEYLAFNSRENYNPHLHHHTAMSRGLCPA